MEMKVEVPFQQLLTVVKTLSLSQKAKLRAELNDDQDEQNNFIEYLLNDPFYSSDDKIIHFKP